MGADDGPALTLGELVDEAARQLDEAGVEDAAISARRIGEAAAGVEPAAFHESRGTALTHRMVAHADDMLRSLRVRKAVLSAAGVNESGLYNSNSILATLIYPPTRLQDFIIFGICRN